MIVLHYPKLNWHDMQHSITVCPSHPSSIGHLAVSWLSIWSSNIDILKYRNVAVR